MEHMINDIKTYLRNKTYVYIDIKNESDCVIIHNLSINNILTNSDSDSEIVNLYYGCYYFFNDDIDNMIKHYLVSINGNCHYAMNNLGYYYESIKDYGNMLKYYLMAIELNNSNAMYDLGNYYKSTNDYDNMIKYCLMAIELNIIYAMNNI